jgi:hypothetical protein
MIKYKVLNADMTSPFQNFQYEIGKTYTCHNFDEGPKQCSTGFYATDLEGIIYSFRPHRRVFLAEMGGRNRKFDQFKHRFETQTLIEEVSHNKLKKLLAKECHKVGYNILEACFPIHPLHIKRKSEVSIQEMQWLKEWDSVRDSVWESVWDSMRNSVWESVRNSVWESVRNSVWESMWESVWESVRDSVRDSVWESVWKSVWDSVRNSVWESVRAYTSSLFPNIKTWKYIPHEPGINPFQSGINLWKSGLVPSYQDNIWNLHSGKNANIIYSIKKEGL